MHCIPTIYHGADLTRLPEFYQHRKEFSVVSLGDLRLDYPQREGQLPPPHDDLDGATIWTLHLRVPLADPDPDFSNLELGDDTNVLRLLRSILTNPSIAPMLTGDAVGGDSFRQWCEVYNEECYGVEDGRALHVYYYAPSRASASHTGALIAAHAGSYWTNPHHVTSSTGGDWAMQQEVW